MWIWIIIVAVFLFLSIRTMQENADTTRSARASKIGSVADALGLIALALGAFMLLMALGMGFFAGPGPKLSGAALRDVLIWGFGLLAIGVVLIFASRGIRRAGGKGSTVVRVTRGGH